MRAFGSAVEFRGQSRCGGHLAVERALRVTVVAYALALLISLSVLSTSGGPGLALPEVLIEAVVLGFPAALGAPAARLIL